MKNCALLSSNLPSDIDRSNLYVDSKFDRPMKRGKLLDNDTQLFIFNFIIIMSQFHPRDPENRQQNQFSERRLQPVEWESVAYRRKLPSSCPLT